MELLTQKQAADLLCVSIRTVARYRHSGLLSFIKINKTIRIQKLAVVKLLGESRWQEKQKIHTLNGTQTETSTSCLTPEDVAREKHFGRKIWKSQRHGSRAG